MGWLISQDLSKDEQIRELVQGWHNEEKGRGGKFLAHSVRGNTLFAVLQPYKVGEPERVEDRIIIVFLLRKDRGAGWGYKDMDETMNPYYYNCPLKFLELAPHAHGQYSEEWRAGVRAYHAKRKAMAVTSGAIAPGVRFRFADGYKIFGQSADGETGTILRKSGRGYLARVGGMDVKIMRRHIGKVFTE